MQTGIETTPSLLIFIGPLFALAIIAAFTDSSNGKNPVARRNWFDGYMGLWAGVVTLCIVGLLDIGGIISETVFLATCRIVVVVTILASLVLWARSTPSLEDEEEDYRGDTREPAA